jgi:hypothetical protein
MGALFMWIVSLARPGDRALSLDRVYLAPGGTHPVSSWRGTVHDLVADSHDV